MMEPLHSITKLSAQEWFTSEVTQNLMRALGDKHAMFVGGCVRNALLEKPVKDVDIATQHRPEFVIECLRNAGFTVIPTGVEHGTVTAVTNGCSYEITTLRYDVNTNGRHAHVSFTSDWIEDAKRRDFTMNTLLSDSSGFVYDPLGCGFEDLKVGRIIFVGDAAQRIQEDYLRILRFFRFHALYGKGAPSLDALEACQAAAGEIKTLSRERITQEMLKIIASDKAASTLKIMFEHNVMKDFAASHYDSYIFKKLCDLQMSHKAIDVFARLLSVAGVQNIRQTLRLSKAQLKFLDVLEALKNTTFDNVKAVKTALYYHGREAVRQALLIAAARGRVEDEFLAKAIPLTREWDIPVFAVSGDDLIKEGYNPGPELGRELKRREDQWIADKF